MPVRRPFARLLWWTGTLGAGVLAVVGGLALRGPGLVGVGIAGTLAACIAVGIARDAPGRDRRSVVESAVQASCWTVGVLLGLAGAAALAGGSVALLAGGACGIAWLVRHVARSRPSAASGAEVLRRPVPPPAGPMAAAPSPLSALTTSALGREWMRTTAGLGGRLTPADRAALVQRRQETLDELERRDPAGFTRWLATGPASGSDPATYIHARPVRDDPTAGTDAA
ncbi:hypothetical protein [Blastococcus mobilis]|uniref:Uncharacterized protein n=1 Tax=Blastococcus mobilis TaxID=1938746 RepID=A0A238VZD1_9ACTN|nr:hypothetical protein [Blastococcus mobilis]SNR39705.1 hypothetical protein SAMN06272737_105205 [Blastococcus mobilis]